MKKAVFLFLFCAFVFQTYAQNTIVQVIDKQTENPVPFAKISDGVDNHFITDIDGKKEIIIHPNRNYTFRFFGYKEVVIKGEDLLKTPRIYLTPDAQVYDEIVVTPGENPAHRIIRNVMDHKNENDPLRNNSFFYNSYSKFYITGELKEGILRDTIQDTSTLDALELMDRQYLFLIETKANRTFNPPNYDKEEVTSYNVSGIKEPFLAAMVNQFQSFSFYDNMFSLGNSEYINPIAPGGLRRYLFIIEDTLIHPDITDTTYTISYRPRKGKKFDGLEGYLYIHTKDWAIERVISSPYQEKVDTTALKVKVIQEYAFTNDKKWFPKKISTEVDFPIEFSNYGNLIGRSSLYIRDVEFDVEAKKGFNPVSVEVSDNALADSTALKEARGDTYTGKEELTYEVLDSLAEEVNLDRYIELLKIASSGVIPIRMLGIPIDKIITYNLQEGVRLGLALETNQRFSKVVQMGGYFAYGFKDKQWKWGGDLNLTLYQKRQIKLNLHYSDDLHQRGSTDYYSDVFNLTDQSLYHDFYLTGMDRERFAGIRLSGLITQNMKLQLVGNYKRFTFFDNYTYTPLFTDNGTLDQYDIAEVGIVFNWNIRERVMMLENQRFSLGSKWPNITLKAMRGLSGVFEANYDYYRLNLEIAQDFAIRGVGKIKLLSRSGITYGNVPITLSQMQDGTGKQFNLFVPNTFQTMIPMEFLSDRFSSLFFRFEFLPLRNKTTWTEPLFSIHSAAGFGTIQNRTDHNGFDFQTPEKGFYESGLMIDNLIKIRFLGIGVGAFYRYGPYELPKWNQNLIGKISARINF